ncbi:MAG: DUF2079 domain-containing protein [Phycisphaerae bacterium]
MADSDSPPACPRHDYPAATAGAVVGVLVPILTFAATVATLQWHQFHVINYRAYFSGGPIRYWPPLVFALLLFLAVIVPPCLAVVAGYRPRAPYPGATPDNDPRMALCRWHRLAFMVRPLLLVVPFMAYGFLHAFHTNTELTVGYALSLPLILGAAWTTMRTVTMAMEAGAGRRLFANVGSGPREVEGITLASPDNSPPSARSHRLAVASILLLIALLTWTHTAIQINFFEHFMYGHADIGHFAEELSNALAGRGLRSHSFDNIRLGWHFVPLMYALIPLYALWPSPVCLMAVSAVTTHIAAVPVYYLARRLSGRVAVAWMWAVAWLLLPSVSRLVYCHTYGFQMNNFTIPLIVVMIAATLTHRWKTACAMMLLVMSVRETAAAAVLGWGLYIACFTKRRWLGIAAAVIAVGYALLCVKILIPHFSAQGRFERLDMFGVMGNSLGELIHTAFSNPGLVVGRLLRVKAQLFILTLLVPMALLPLRGWRIALACLPTLLLVALLQGDDWLSIKFWHHASILPFLFVAGLAATAIKKRPGEGQGQPSPITNTSTDRSVRFESHATATGPARPLALAATALTAAAWGHYLYGFSPLAKAYEPCMAVAYLHQPDPRLAVVRRLRAEIGRDRSVLATERMAAHWTDQARLYTGRRALPADYVIIDRSDQWDTSGLPQRAAEFAADPRYRLYSEYGSIVVFQRRHE